MSLMSQNTDKQPDASSQKSTLNKLTENYKTWLKSVFTSKYLQVSMSDVRLVQGEITGRLR